MTSDKPSKRLLSLDALRGFDMLLISGGGTFIALMHGKTDMGWLNTIALQMEHPDWGDPITFFDFIFPLFLFISGVSLSFSINSRLARGVSRPALYRKAAIRMALLIVLGIFYKNVPLNIYDPAHIRYSSVLGRIGLATFFTTLLYVNYSWQQRLLWVAGILLSFYAAMFLIPVPGYGAGDLSMEGNLMGYIDRAIMPGRLINGVYDENALATSLPAFTLTILGAWAGDILRNRQTTPNYKAGLLAMIGAGSIGLGILWGLHFPIIKKLWSGSFILVTGGASFMALSLFYWLIDVKKITGWAFFFEVIGLNSLLIYLANRYIDFNYTSARIFSGFYTPVAEKWHEVIETFGAMILVWLFLYFFYKKRIFLKV